ncbi:hypothetical protein [Bradyrhizobium niftali]|uniref:Uncharacterized protein n=1 Tax=Bradyrhizobium niftali TaxID=2560055 RepID=A0A4Y9M3E2_9BRAD|nr:hypothetical protein [Bradyrhizobium niftali]TFV49622.1 hypothetical protein E4K65_05325 [Bradyrhizobium niftali]
MRLEIGRMSLDCLVDANHSNPARASERVQALSRRMPSAMASWLDGLAGGDEIVLIRSLNLDVTIDVDHSDALNLARWSKAFASALAGKLAANGQGVVRFTNRAEQLAQFIRDFGRGDAWSLWFHRPFEGLRGLPAPQALAAALSENPLVALDALASLDDATLLRTGDVLGSWSERFIAAFPAAADAVPPDKQIIDCLCEGALRFPPSSRTARLLATMVAYKAATSVAPGPDELALCSSVVEILEQVEARRDAEGSTPAFLPPSDGDREASRTGEVRLRTQSALYSARIAARACALDIRRISTTIGGPLLLLREVDRLDFSAVPPVAPHDDFSAQHVFRTLVLARLAGPSLDAEFLRDPFWRNLLAVPANLQTSTLRDWANSALRGPRTARGKIQRPPDWPSELGLERTANRLLTQAAGEVLAQFAHRLPGFSGSSSLHLWQNFLNVRATAAISIEQFDARIARPPLDPILAISGAAVWTETFGWTRPPRVSVARETS